MSCRHALRSARRRAASTRKTRKAERRRSCPGGRMDPPTAGTWAGQATNSICARRHGRGGRGLRAWPEVRRREARQVQTDGSGRHRALRRIPRRQSGSVWPRSRPPEVWRKARRLHPSRCRDLRTTLQSARDSRNVCALRTERTPPRRRQDRKATSRQRLAAPPKARRRQPRGRKEQGSV